MTNAMIADSKPKARGGRRPTYGPTLIARAMDLYAEGRSCKAVAEALNVSDFWVRKQARAAGILRDRDDVVAMAIALGREGMAIQEIADRVGISRTFVGRKLREAGVERAREEREEDQDNRAFRYERESVAGGVQVIRRLDDGPTPMERTYSARHLCCGADAVLSEHQILARAAKDAVYCRRCRDLSWIAKRRGEPPMPILGLSRLPPLPSVMSAQELAEVRWLALSGAWR